MLNRIRKKVCGRRQKEVAKDLVGKPVYRIIDYGEIAIQTV